ncbi:peptide-methionine (S)-S-oxide reductase MsrA [Salipiger bermudensis]|uniref:Peptide methionine sulfoxide reductase MsrA n=1 Tax=Salipiger bermudensis (strain DSM 26914 / JCM 13377 / KCTC 12554 / HTCC2601) TaxID=314265 RepID=Q0FV90_SALBH|nr:peptide-methionine (S)-S-oxide reductase MsrA [Salipiger bermudensis]EAU48236.1 methionine-S-sulfoxide reductase [Salipiger bermudensis HTCC2601]
MFRSIILSALIVMGLCVQSQRAEAGERRDIVVAGGCFWCVEADFEKVRGVLGAVSGYTGGTTANPTYKEVSRGGTGHYEAVKITYDSAQVSAGQLYDMFFRSVDPTDAGGQFCDRGESYRTAIFVSDAGEKAAAEQAKAQAQAALGQSIVTPILQGARFYEAEDYHQDYYKSDDLILSRFGPISKAKAYVRYRDACGRDQRVRQLWGSDAPFVGG